MRVRFERLNLEGANRSVSLSPGLNVITGPIATGKSTLLRLARALLGGSFEGLPVEAREALEFVSADLMLGERKFTIRRPAVTTRTARVEIAGDDEAYRLPFAQPESSGELTYLDWVLDQLGLPRLDVPAAPTRVESAQTPVSINDYLLYCTLTQTDIGSSVFGHHDSFKDIKRRYVFQIIYGLYTVEIAQLQEQLRSVQAQIRDLSAQVGLFERFLKDTALENRTKLEHDLSETTAALAGVELSASAKAQALPGSDGVASLRQELLTLDAEIGQTRQSLQAEKSTVQNLQSLAAQLEKQIDRLTRAIVAGKYLAGIEYVVCPRCGSSVDANRATQAHTCYLCLQEPTESFSRDVLVDEQARVEAQLTETRDLIATHQAGIDQRQSDLDTASVRRKALSRELDFLTRSFVSQHASDIAAAARKRAELTAKVEQLKEYLQLLDKLGETRRWLSDLIKERQVLEARLQAASAEEAETQKRIRVLARNYNDILESFDPPKFGEETASSIDPRTYLPTYHGRRFDELSSPGLATLVNVAHAMAQQETSLGMGLKLPNIVFIDGLSEHLGEEGLDPRRLEKIYKYLIDCSDRLGDVLQILVVDNDIPQFARKYVRLELSEDMRLIVPNVASAT
ncbi:MAG: AAA family ATPase [Burkholderiales bacterium]